MHVWLNGSLVDADEARLPIDDHGLSVGDGAFETLKTSGGVAFAVTRHLRRLANGLSALAIEMSTEDVLRSAIAETVEAAGHAEARIRLTVTAGSGSLGSGMPGGAPSVSEIAHVDRHGIETHAGSPGADSTAEPLPTGLHVPLAHESHGS